MVLHTLFQLTIASALAITLSACGGGDSGGANGTNTATSTAGVACDYSHSAFNSNSLVNLSSVAAWTCSSSTRTLTANGVPDHDVGPFAIQNDLDFQIKAQSVRFSTSMAPVLTSTAKELGGPREILA